MTVPTQREPKAPERPCWVRELVRIGVGGLFGPDFHNLPQDLQDELLERSGAQQELIRQMMVCARNYKERAMRSMLLATQARKDYLEVHDTDAGLGDLPLWKAHVNDNRWYMEWSRVYDGHAQMEMKAYELGMY